MKKLFSFAVLAMTAVQMTAQSDWKVLIGTEEYPMTLIEGSDPATYTATVTCVPEEGKTTNFYARMTDGTNTSNNVTTSFSLSETKDVQFWAQYPKGKNWIAGLCSEMTYPIVNDQWKYLCIMPTTAAAANAQSVTYFNTATAVKAANLKSALGSKAPSDTKWLTAGSTGNPPFAFNVKNGDPGIKKITLDYSLWKLTVEAATAIDVVIGDAGSATLCAPADLTIPEGVKAYTLAYQDNELKATEVATTIPANKPVLVNAEAGTYSFVIAGDANVQMDAGNTYVPDIAATSENVLSGTLIPHYVPENSYVLQNGVNGVGFYKVTGTSNYKIDNFRCYIPSSAIPAGARSLSIVFDDSETTGIADVRGKMGDERSDIFNLAGQRVGKDYKGVVIMNGKKVVMK